MQPFGRGSDRKPDADGVRAPRVCFPLTPALSPRESICLAERGHSCPQQRTLLDLGLYSGCAFVRKMLRTGMSALRAKHDGEDTGAPGNRASAFARSFRLRSELRRYKSAG